MQRPTRYSPGRRRSRETIREALDSRCGTTCLFSCRSLRRCHRAAVTVRLAVRHRSANQTRFGGGRGRSGRRPTLRWVRWVGSVESTVRTERQSPPCQPEVPRSQNAWLSVRCRASLGRIRVRESNSDQSAKAPARSNRFGDVVWPIYPTVSK
jgi:hypothetical protein